MYIYVFLCLFLYITKEMKEGRRLVRNKEEKEKRKGKGAEVNMADIHNTLERNCLYKTYHCIL